MELYLLIELAYGVVVMPDETYARLLDTAPGAGAVNASLATMTTVLLFGRRTAFSIFGQHYCATLVGAFFVATGLWQFGAFVHGGTLWLWIGLHGWVVNAARKIRQQASPTDAS